MTKAIEKLELAILSDVFRYRHVVDLKLPNKYIIHMTSWKSLTGDVFWESERDISFTVRNTVVHAVI